MTNEKIDFYQEVEICSESHYRGLKGAVLGVSEEGQIVYGYAVLIHGAAQSIYFDKSYREKNGHLF